MADYRIVCVNTVHPHRHIATVGTATVGTRASRIWSVTEVRTPLEEGDTFHTISISTGARADVYRGNCRIDDAKSRRSAPLQTTSPTTTWTT